MAEKDPTPQPRSGPGEGVPKKANGKDVHVKDPQGYEIMVAVETWEKHIIVHHPEVKDHLDLVAETLANAQVIQALENQLDVCFYYRLTGRSFFRETDLYMSVVVQRDAEAKTGFVKTAYLTKTIRKGGKVIWLKRN